jgi:hypothetical protein
VTEKRKRRWYQFSLRALLVLVLLVSVGMSWFAAKLEKARRQKEAVQAIGKLGGFVIYEGNRLPTGEVPHGAPRVQAPWPSWLETVLGQDFFWDAERVYWYGNCPELTDTVLGYLRDLPGLRLVCLEDTQVTPEGVKKLREALPECEIVY